MVQPISAKALLDVERLEHLELLLDAEVRRVAGEVGEVARGSRRTAGTAPTPARAAALDQVLDDRAVLARELVLLLGRLGLAERLDLHPERAADVRLAATEPGAVLTLEDRHLGAGSAAYRSRRAAPPCRSPEPAVDAGDEQDQLVALARRVDGSLLFLGDAEGDVHVGHHHHVVEREDWQQFGLGFGHALRDTRDRSGLLMGPDAARPRWST